MRAFKLSLGRTIVLETEGEEAGKLDHSKEQYSYIAFSKIGKNGELLQIGCEPCDAKHLVAFLQDDPLFSEEAHIEVWKYDDTKLFEFDGTLFDALLVATNEGAQYDL